MRFLTWMFMARTSRLSPDVGYTAKIRILKRITTLSNNIAGNELMSGAPQRYIKNVFTKKLHKYTFSAKASNTSLNINAIGAVYIRCTSGVL